MMAVIRLMLICFAAFLFIFSSSPQTSVREQLSRHRNLGKAYYENPVNQIKAVEEFKQALALAPNSTRDRVNYGLALLRVGKTEEAIAELTKAQKQDPSIPHTWFNLGIVYKKQAEPRKAIEQFEGMLKLVPNEPVTHYNLGVEYKLVDKPEMALQQFMKAAELNPNFAAPHFQLYNAYRQLGRKEDAGRELDLFNEIKKRKAGAAIPEDPEWSYYSEIYDVVELDQEFDTASAPPFKFQVKKIASGIDAATAGMAVLDFDGDGKPDLIVWSENGVLLLKNGSTPVANSGLESLKGVVSIAPGDFNNDGLPDLAVLTHSGASLYVNHDGKFESYAAKLPSGSFTKAVWVDYDHDYTLDLFLLGSKSVLLRNDGTAGFSDQTAHLPFAPGRVVDATVFDLVPNNNETDLAALYDDGSLVVYHDQLLGNYAAQPLPFKVPGGSTLHALDINNDGWTDLIAAGSTAVHVLVNDHGKLQEGPSIPASKGPLLLADLANRSLADLVVNDSVYRNMGQGKFEPAAARLPKSAAMAQADFNEDDRVDLVVVAQDGSLEMLTNETPTTNHAMRVRLEGVKNLKIPMAAIVEVKAGAWYQKRMYEGAPLLFGLRDYSEADTVRITWPNGLIQNETRQPVGQQLAFKEKARLSGSCPMIFAWNGKHFQFITDVLGVAPLGASSGDGQYFPVNHRENIQIPASSLKAQDGRYEIRITEELREVSYLDQVQLIAVDHPAGEEVFINDKFKGPPFPEFRLYGVTRRTYPFKAVDQNGVDVLARLARRDGIYVDSFHRDSSGVAELHYLELDFGKATAANRAVLVLNGWVDWADGSTFMAAAHASKEGLIFPYLQVKDASGHWQTVVEDMGIPSGKPKSIVVDLIGKFLSASREVRIVTNLCVYWDEIFLSEAITPHVRMTRVSPAMASLRYRGFSKPTIHPARTQPEGFDYEQWFSTTGWNPTPGLYTRYGDVRALLASMDDRMVIMGSGDELRLLFDARAVPFLASGWRRDFLLLVDGWAKDADSNTAFSRSVEPLPFHGMESYPYPSSQHFPDDEIHLRYQKEFNTRQAVDDLSQLRP
ncbi:MAG TPA: FG-GAP-like repeat-containing protein [Candidatus Angelobacter sp.]